MRVTQVILSKQLGGAERHVVDLSNELAKRHDVQVILRRPPRRYANLQYGGNISSMLNPGVLVQEVGDVFRNRRIRRLVRKFRPDIIHTHLGDAGKALGAIRPDAPLIGTLHGVYKDKSYRVHDALICVAEWQRRTITDTFSGRVVTIPNFILERLLPRPSDIQALRHQLEIPAETLVIGAVGRLAPEKGFDTLLGAFDRAGLKGASLILLGDGPLREELAARKSSNVIFGGWQTDPWPYLNLFDIFVASSRSEAFGIAILEALQAGTPVISTRAEGPSEILADGSGILVDIDDTEGIAEALRMLASSADLRMDLAEKGRKKAVDYSVELVVPKIEALYDEMIS
jgi:glycosyltransferase involved in cell wall biosynthesis